MKSIMIDMDYVITSNNIDKMMEMYLGCKVDLSDYKEYRKQDFLKNKKHDFLVWLKDNNYYEYAILNYGCYEVMKKLNKVYKIYIVTDYLWPEDEMISYTGKFLNDKFNYLYKSFDFLDPKNIIFAADKELINCDIKIDDRISNLEGARTKLLFTAYHNKNISNTDLSQDGIIRVNNWYDIENILLGNK